MRPDQSDIRKAIADVRGNYYLFFKWVWPILSSEKLIWNWHIEAIATELQILGGYIIDRKKAPYDMIINVPPGMTKSSLVTQAFPIWLWLHDPSISVITSSYSDGLSTDNSLKARSIIESEGFYWFQENVFKPIFKYPLVLVKSTEKYWINNFGGWYYATSTKGTVTGKHAHLIIRDDPLNPQQANSEAERLTCNRFNDLTLGHRKKDKEANPTITVMQRLHDDDPTGHDLTRSEKEIFHICLPAEKSNDVKPGHWSQYYVDGMLDPIRLSKAVLRNEFVRMGSYAYAGQYQQKTAPEEGGKIQRSWFEKCRLSEVPERIVRDLWIDGAYTKNTDNDPTGLMVCGYDEGENKLYIFHATDGYMEMPTLMNFLPGYCMDNKIDTVQSRIYIEPKATGLTLKQLLNAETNYNATSIRSHLVSEGKEARIQIASPKLQSGRIILVEGAWNENFIAQLVIFPNGLHDEFVDLLGYATDHYFPRSRQRAQEPRKAVTKEQLGFY